MSVGVKSSVTFLVSSKLGSLSPCGLSRDHVDIACIIASAVWGISSSIKLGMGPVKWVLLFITRVGWPAVELLHVCFPSHLLTSLFSSRGRLHDLVLWWACILLLILGRSSSIHFLAWLAMACSTTTWALAPRPLILRPVWVVTSTCSWGWSTLLEPWPLALPCVFVMLTTRPPLWSLQILLITR